MKTLSTLFLLLFFINCNAGNKDIRLIQSFMKKIILNERSTYYDTKKFIPYDPRLHVEQEKKFAPVINAVIKYIREELLEHDWQYEIVSHRQVVDEGIKLSYNFVYDGDHDQVYHLISHDQLITSFVVDNHKIISFSYHLTKNSSSPRKPLLLNRLIK